MRTSKVSRLPILFSVLSFVLIALGALGVVFLQSPLLRQSQDLRKAASIDNGLVQVAANPSSGTTLGRSPNPVITLTANTQNVQVDGLQMVFKVVTNSSSLNFAVLPESNLQAVFQEVEKVSDGYLVSVIALPQTFGQSFSSTSPTNFGKITLAPNTTGNVSITFDTTNSLSTVTNSDPPDDQLKTIPALAYTIAGTATPTPAASSNPSPSPSSQVIASPSPTPTPAATVRTCNQSCSKNADCDINLSCVSGYCRRADNPSNTSCTVPSGDQGIHRACNEYCADSSECNSGLTCFYNRCRTPSNPDSGTCSTSTATTSQAVAQSCNQACSNNKDCAVNLRCYNGACRFATNPGSLSCSPYTSSTVSSLYGYNTGVGGPGATDTSTGSKGQEIPEPSPTSSAKPEDKVITFPSPSPITSGSSMYGNSTTGQNSDNTGSTTDQSALQALAATASDKLAIGGLGIPQLIIAVGVLLLLLALIIFVISTLKNSTRGGSAAKVTKTPSEYEQKLQSRISELRGQQAQQAKGTATAGTDLPSNFRASSTMPLTSTVANGGSKPGVPVPPPAARVASAPVAAATPAKPITVPAAAPVAPVAPTPTATAVPAPVTPAAPTTSSVTPPAGTPANGVAGTSTAMQKLKDRGLM